MTKHGRNYDETFAHKSQISRNHQFFPRPAIREHPFAPHAEYRATRWTPRTLLTSADPDQPDVLGSAIVFGAMLLSLVAFFLNLAPIVRNVRAGNSITAIPGNLLLAVVILFFVTMFVGGIIVDQYPCWIGVPNCD
jgi:hypothetical protein